MSIFDGKLEIEAACASGIEAVAKRELKGLGYEPGGAIFGRIRFEGTYADVARANMFLRTCERVRVVLGSFKAETFDQLYDGMRALDYKNILTPDAKIIVNAKSQNSKLFALRSIQSVAHKAIINSVCEAFHINAIEESGATYDFEVSIIDDEVTVKLDTTGVSLHKRGYRSYLGDAPIKETLASAMILLSVWDPDRPLIDPFCGSGTIPVEAALIGLDIAPGIGRTFAYEAFKNAPVVRDAVQQEAEERIKRDKKLSVSGFDIDSAAIKLALKHAKNAGIAENVHFQTMDMRNVSSSRPYGVIITNPPYGERLLDEAQIKALYRDFGAMCKGLREWSVYCITSFRAFEKYFGKRADRIRKLYNSELECNYYQFLGKKPPKRSSEVNI